MMAKSLPTRIEESTMPQERKSPSKSTQDDEQVQETPQGAEVDETLAAETDDLLDEIDDVLETNAEDFVKGFIQKGGE